MDYSFFDGLIDAVFVVGEDRGILYCNESAAKLCDSSVRRLAKGKPIFETIEFSDANLFVMPNGEQGRDAPAPYVELKFNLKSGKTGKVQIAIQPFTEPTGDKRWAIMLRDVTLEEVLHAKYHKQLEEKEVYIKQLQDAQTQLENYSKNLEHMVEERTLEVKRANGMLNAIMNSLGQGFFVFDEKGVCADIYTRACEDILEAVPANKKVWDVLKVAPNELETFHLWLKAVYGEQLPFDTIKELGPGAFKHSQERHVKLDYFPLRNDESKIANVVVVATDKTSEYLANKALEKEKKYARMVLKLVTSKRQFGLFIESAVAVIRDVTAHVRGAKLDHEYVFRMLHTLEGEAGTYSAMDIWAASRASQEVIEPLKRGEAVDREAVKTKLIESLAQLQQTYMQFMAENRELFAMVGLSGDTQKEATIELRVQDVESIVAHAAQRGVSHAVCEELMDNLLREPIGKAFGHYQDTVSVVAEKLNKKMKPLEFKGMDLRIHHGPYLDLFSTFVHVFRNAVDHGIEPSEEREMMGKPAEGHITITAERFRDQNGAGLRLCVQDDGGGIAVDRLRNKMLQNMAPEKVAAMNDQDVIQQVFAAGVSTKQEVGEFSGRGIGLNAVKAEAERLGGRAWVDSTPGQGTRLTVEVPDLPRLARQDQAA